jgi:hypothetical protein
MKSKASLVVSLLIGLLLTGCQVEKFSMPTWDVILNVPLMNTNYYVSDLVDSVHFYADVNNTLVFQTNGDVQSVEAGNVGIETNISTGILPMLSGQPDQIQIPGLAVLIT